MHELKCFFPADARGANLALLRNVSQAIDDSRRSFSSRRGSLGALLCLGDEIIFVAAFLILLTTYSALMHQTMPSLRTKIRRRA